jgi:hypothetical protein
MRVVLAGSLFIVANVAVREELETLRGGRSKEEE